MLVVAHSNLKAEDGEGVMFAVAMKARKLDSSLFKICLIPLSTGRKWRDPYSLFAPPMV